MVSVRARIALGATGSLAPLYAADSLSVSSPRETSTACCARTAVGGDVKAGRLHYHTLMFILTRMATIRKTISLPAQIAKRLDSEAKRRGTSVSAIVAELVQRQPERLPYAGLIDDDEELSQNVEQILARLGA